VSGERSGLEAWHSAPCAWCDAPSKGDAWYYNMQGSGIASYWYASCGKHGENFQPFTDSPSSIRSGAAS
jgi:hypothetical protein